MTPNYRPSVAEAAALKTRELLPLIPRATNTQALNELHRKEMHGKKRRSVLRAITAQLDLLQNWKEVRLE